MVSSTSVPPAAAHAHSDGSLVRDFATIDTPSGFPMPDLPSETQRTGYVRNCQETDVDEYVCKIILNKVDKKKKTNKKQKKKKPVDWTTVIYDKRKVRKWMKHEELAAKEQPKKEKAYFRRDGKGTVRYAVEECQWLHRNHCNSSTFGNIATIHKNGFVLAKDDNLIKNNEAFRISFMNDVRRLENDELAQKSTIALHPRYSKVVTQLVHPSMYAYEKGVTHVLPNVGAEATSMPPFASFLGRQGVVNQDRPLYNVKERMNHSYPHLVEKTAAQCSNFQWLPSEFVVSTKGNKKTCHIQSYINNLHPVHYKGLYDQIGELFVEALPMLEQILTQTNDRGEVRRQLPRFETSHSPREYRPHWNRWLGVRDIAEWEARVEKEYKNKKVVPEPPIPPFVPPKYSLPKPTKVRLTDRPLQVIVKIVHWNLSPLKKSIEEMSFEEMRKEFKNPTHDFGGGHWHVEGTHDERIVASACCYLEEENVNTEGLFFRDGSVGSLGCELGKVGTNPGRIVAWPNYLHHKSGGISLHDETKPGSRTLCCFHLVDPTLRIRSTATVPPQQSSWITSMVDSALTKLLPDDVQWARSKIMDSMTNLHVTSKAALTYEGAIERRERLSEERSRDEYVIGENFWIPSD